MQEKEILTLSPYENFVYALKATATKRQYPNRLERFLSFIGLQGTIQEKCDKLFQISDNKEILQSYLIRFINFQKQRIEDKEVSDLLVAYSLGNPIMAAHEARLKKS